MPNVRTFRASFAGGEISPDMFGRIDDAKFQSGAAKIRNMYVLPQGPVQNRPGTKFVREVKNSAVKTRLLPFTYSTDQTMIIELGAGYIRFHTQGATLMNGAVPYEITNPYAESELFDIHFVQSADILTLVHRNHAPMELQRISATNWTLIVISYQTSIEPPSPVSVTSSTGLMFNINSFTQATPGVFTTVTAHGLFPDDGVYLTPVPYVSKLSAGFYIALAASGSTISLKSYSGGVQISTANFNSTVTIPVASPCVVTWNAHGLAINDQIRFTTTGTLPTGLALVTTYYVKLIPSANTFQVSSTVGGAPINATAAGTGVHTASVFYIASSGQIQPALKTSTVDNYYAVTCIASNGIDETSPSVAVNIVNNLNVNGASNTISWPLVTGALRYNIYKLQSGLYGYIGQSETTSFVDDNIAPDMGITTPIFDTVFDSAGNYPGAVSYFEQRRVFAGSTNEPQRMWMTRSGTESDMSYSIPSQDNDRVSIKVAAREANPIRHIIPMSQLILLTSAAEWRVTPVNSDAVTPTTISVRPQSYIGANNVQPWIINNSIVYCAARGGHVREMGFSWQSNGFVTGDLSLRATHLFDSLNIVDMSFSKAPHPLVWFVSDNGILLGLTYVPEQQIGSWHHHDTDGLFETVAVVAEGIEDHAYVVVNRTIGGVMKRYIERFEKQEITVLEDSYHVDCGGAYDGNNTAVTTMTLATTTVGDTAWGPADPLLTVTSSLGGTFLNPVSTDLNDAIVITHTDGVNGTKKYRLKITGTTSGTVANVRVDIAIPASLQGVAKTSWGFARDRVGGLSHLEGKTVSILGDGAVMPQQVVVSGSVALSSASVKIQVGLQFHSDLQTLPMSMSIEGFGQGRAKNINKAWIRVFKSSGIFIGPDADNLVEAKQRTTEPYGSPPALKTDEIQVVLTPAWAQDGQIYIRQSDPLPLMIVGLAIEAAIGA